jgi:hypothetical protein
VEGVVGVALVAGLAVCELQGGQQRVFVLLLRRKGDDGRSAAADGGARASLEVVGRCALAKERRLLEMDVGVDAPGLWIGLKNGFDRDRKCNVP